MARRRGLLDSVLRDKIGVKPEMKQPGTRYVSLSQGWDDFNIICQVRNTDRATPTLAARFQLQSPLAPLQSQRFFY